MENYIIHERFSYPVKVKTIFNKSYRFRKIIGITHCFILKNDCEIYHGFALCNIADRYERKIGKNLAEQRAKNSINPVIVFPCLKDKQFDKKTFMKNLKYIYKGILQTHVNVKGE